VFATNGCFDILHIAHLNLLQKAKKEGDILIVMLNSDSSIKKFKGKDRPIVSEYERACMLASIEPVDYVVIFNEDDPDSLIKEVKPMKIVKGGTSIPEKVEQHKKTLSEWGGEFVQMEMEEGYSSTDVINRILNNNGKG
jgi:rfaE bifunctional protein nucleotidyltransferase chain/domain